MDTKKLVESEKDPKYISGIYNYCDRWCERCQFTSRCLNCTLVEEQFGDLEDIDLDNKTFWERFTEVLKGTFDMIKEMAEEAGIELNAVEAESKKYINKNPVTDIITYTAESYIRSVEIWFKSNEYTLYKKDNELSQVRLLSEDENPNKEVSEIKDAIEVIRWYQCQILVKLKRAYGDSLVEKSLDDHEFNIPSDSNGYAKVALIGMDRSISAWNMLSVYFSEQKNEILKTTALLENLKRKTELRFPLAREFVRPGFDEL